MPGPGRSKGCTNCKARRIKCDETRPTCNRCHKSGLQCAGYKKPIKFVDETYWTRGKHGLIISSPSSSLMRAGVTSKEEEEEEEEEDDDDEGHDRKRGLKFYSTTDLQRNLDASVISFLRGVFVPRNTDFSSWYYSPHHSDDTDPASAGGGAATASDKDLVMSTSSKRPFLPGVTLQALALGLHGQKCGSHASLGHAAELYGFAVKNLRLDLMDVRSNALAVSRRVVPLMDSMLNLALYEMIQSDNDLARNYHLKALAKLIEMQGPHAFRYGPARRLFLRARSLILIPALEEDKKTFLADEQWQTIPWIPEGGGTPEGKGFVNRFLDILLCIPSLLQDQETLRQATTSLERKRIVASMRESIAALNERLLDMRLDWEILKPRSAYEVPITNVDSSHAHGKLSRDGNGSPLFKSIIYYQDLQSCTEMGVYYSCLYFLRCIATAIGMTASTPQRAEHNNKTNQALKFPDEITTGREAGLEICRSAEYFLQPGHGITGAYFLMMPLRLAQVTFVAEEEEDRRLARWVCGIMRYIGDNHGLHNAYAFCNG